ncbi:hypothetical protein HDU76_010689, partial [Blyttiomyces sp. JEL0837]
SSAISSTTISPTETPSGNAHDQNTVSRIPIMIGSIAAIVAVTNYTITHSLPQTDVELTEQNVSSSVPGLTSVQTPPTPP